jgi:hypothetical protein
MGLVMIAVLMVMLMVMVVLRMVAMILCNYLLMDWPQVVRRQRSEGERVGGGGAMPVGA